MVRRIEKSGFEGRTLTLKVKYFDFVQITRSLSSSSILKTKDEILPLAKKLLGEVDFSSQRPIRLLGLSVSHSSMSEEALDGAVWEEGWLDFDAN